MSYTDEDLTTRHLALRALLEQLVAKHKAELSPWQDMQDIIENEMLRRLNERAADNSSTPAGTFFKVRGTSVKVTDKVVFLDHVFAQRLNNLPNCYDMLTQAVSKDSVTAFIKDNGGQPPPGVEVTSYIKIQVRKG